MTGSPEEECVRLDKRINDLEMKLEYLQRDYETQNEMLLVDAKRILQLEAIVKRLGETVELMSSNSESPKSLEDEKPPHY